MADSSDYDDLIRPDPVTAHFGPEGLMTDRALRSEGSAKFLTALIKRAQLSAGVPNDVRRSFERVRELFRYGVFRYDFFTLAGQVAWTLPETALGVRFVEWYEGMVPFVRNGQEAVLETDRYSTVAEALEPRGRHPHQKGWRLRGHEGSGKRRSFNGSYRALLDWAYAEGLLARWLDDRWGRLSGGIVYAISTQVRRPTSPERFVAPSDWVSLGLTEREAWFDLFKDASAVPDNWTEMTQADRVAWLGDYRRIKWEREDLDVLVVLRNLVAHADAGTLQMPSQAADAIYGVAELINGLWSEPIAGAPATR
jgi:hypothetical protein